MTFQKDFCMLIQENTGSVYKKTQKREEKSLKTFLETGFLQNISSQTKKDVL